MNAFRQSKTSRASHLSKAAARVVTLAATSALLHCGGDDTSVATKSAPDASTVDATLDGPGVDATTLEAAADASDGAVEAGVPAATFATSPIDFGIVDCGGTAADSQTLKVANTGSATLTYSAAVSGSVFFFLGPVSGVLEPGTSAIVTLAPNAIDPSIVAGTVQGATLTLTTNDPAHGSTAIPVKQTAGGGTLTVVPTSAAFGPVTVGTTQTLPLTLTNSGNEPVDMNFTAPSDPQFSLTWTGAPADVTVPPGGSVPGLVASYTPASAVDATSSAPLIVNTALCASTLQAITLTGTGQ